MAAKNEQIHGFQESVAERQIEAAANQRPNFDEGVTQKTSRKIKENPMVPIGMAGFFVAVAYGVKHFRSRPSHVSASMYIMQFRVFAQSIAVGSMGAGIGYSIIKEKFFKDAADPSKEEKNGTK